MHISQIAVKTEHPQVSPYRALADADNAGAIVGDGLFFNKGLWTRGEAKRTVPADARFVVNMAEGREGWCRWLNHMPVEYRMGRIADGFVVPLRDELGHLDQTVWETNQNGDPQDCWQRAYRLPMKDQAGGLLTFVGSSWGARRGLQQLYGRFDRERKGKA